MVLAEANAPTTDVLQKGAITFDMSSSSVAVEAAGDNDRLFSMKVPMFAKREALIAANATEGASSMAVQAPVARVPELDGIILRC